MASIGKIIQSVIFVVIIIGISGCTNKDSRELIPLPQLTPFKNRLRIAYAINPRFSKMSKEQMQVLLNETKSVVKEHFKLEIEFGKVEEISIDQLFTYLQDYPKKHSQRFIYDFKNNSENKQRLVEAMVDGINWEIKRGFSLEEHIEYAKPYLIRKLKHGTKQELAEISVDSLLFRLKQWQQLKANDGNPVIDQSIYNEWVMWDVLGYGALPYDIVLTNQLIASAEYYGQAVGSAIRGGVATGTTTYNKHSPYGTYAFLTTFVFSNDYEWVIQLRDGKVYGKQEAAKLAGAYLAHEIGHQLFHFAHPPSSTCVMYPAELLKYHEWYKNISSTECSIGSLPQMKRGALKIGYQVNW